MPVKIIEIHGANQVATTKTRVGCRGIVLQGDRMLISHERNADYYLIPGGGLEGDETPEACCVREIREETGYIVHPTIHFLTIHEYYGDYNFVSHYFLCEVTGKTEQQLTDTEAERGLVPEWIDRTAMLSMYAAYKDFLDSNEEKSGAYLREYTALSEYFKQFP
ncbi:MAG: NUDIX domain-containing protein [Oscillospiraceae bacterium]|nr:NUDIX domain-containing protein [Oscillospiraceae bacterium]